MARKRMSHELEPAKPPQLRETSKRARLSPSAEDGDHSSAPSSDSVSEATALQSSPATSARRPSSHSSLDSESHLASEGSLSDSSSAEVSDDDASDDIVTIGGPAKPQIGAGGFLSAAHDIQARLSTFLPRLAAANRELEMQGPGRNLEDVEEGERYIEMNLGLGVLEEKDGDEESSSDSSSDSDGASDLEHDDDTPVFSETPGQAKPARGTRVMDRLLGQKSERSKAGIIEELG